MDTNASEDWIELDRLLEELLSLDDPDRANRLAEISSGNAQIGRRLQRLLSQEDIGAPLESLGDSPVCQGALGSLSGMCEGDTLGDWQLLRRIGRGGMAEVFEAERSIGDGRQRAAIKLMALGLGGADQLRRFALETEILARLEDHRLSRLIDAGTAPDGRPWLSMEYVDGQPIDRACDARRLDLRSRVALVIEVALAVDHAHRQLIVHRDLKPSNVLLTGSGRIKLLDFGIAKLLDAGDSEHTATQARAYTLAYASPEQITGRHTGIDCDIYQLGLILYGLLGGTRAYHDAEDDPVALLGQMRHGPELLSQRVARANPEVAARRGVSSRRLARLLRGDLDSIVMHALEFDPRQRYASARDLADDLQHWLDGRPIRARSYTTAYRAYRYLRRHWLGATALAAIFALTLSYAVTATWQGVRLTEERNEAEQARQRADAIREFLLQVFGSFDPEAQASRGKSVDQLLMEGVERARAEFDGQPLLAAQLLVDMGELLSRRGRLDDAELALRQALDLRQRQLGDAHPESLDILPELGNVLYELGRFSEAHELLTYNLETSQRVDGPNSERVIDALRVLGPAESIHGDAERAAAHLERAIELFRQRHGSGPWPGDPVRAIKRWELEHQLGVIFLRLQRYEEAEALLAGSAAGFEAAVGRLDSRTLMARKNLSYSLRQLRRPDKARALLREILVDERKLYDGAHWQIAYTLGHLANLTSDGGDYATAIDLWQQAEAETRAAVGEEHPWIISTQVAAARLMMLSGREAEGRPILERIAAMTGREDGRPERARQILDQHDGKEHD